jgi:hypothetical protein
MLCQTNRSPFDRTCSASSLQAFLHPSAPKGIEVPVQQVCYTCRSPSWRFCALEEPYHEAALRRERPGPSLTPAPSLFHLGSALGLLPSGLCSARRSKRVSAPHPPLPLQVTLWRPTRLRRVTPSGKQRLTEASHLPSWHSSPLRSSLSPPRPTASCGLLSRASKRNRGLAAGAPECSQRRAGFIPRPPPERD